MNAYLLPLQQYLQDNADSTKAADMTRYMKNLFPYYGVPSSVRGEFFSNYFKNYGKPKTDEVEIIATELWMLPQREYQYFAMEMLKKVEKSASRDIIKLYEYLIINKSWWDTIDFIASNLVGPLFLKFPEIKENTCLNWMSSGNMWLQRTVLLFQLKYRLKTDTDLLVSAIFQLASSKEFFIRKAIGWALREYSKVNPSFTIEFVEKNSHLLSPLSTREALKVINRKRDEV